MKGLPLDDGIDRYHGVDEMKGLVEAFRIARSFINRHAPTLDQAVLEFIDEGHFGYRVRKMRQVYSDRLQLLTEHASRRLSALLDV